MHVKNAGWHPSVPHVPGRNAQIDVRRLPEMGVEMAADIVEMFSRGHQVGVGRGAGPARKTGPAGLGAAQNRQRKRDGREWDKDGASARRFDCSFSYGCNTSHFPDPPLVEGTHRPQTWGVAGGQTASSRHGQDRSIATALSQPFSRPGCRQVGPWPAVRGSSVLVCAPSSPVVTGRSLPAGAARG